MPGHPCAYGQSRSAVRKPGGLTMATAVAGAVKRPPFPLGNVTDPWMEQAQARIAEQRFVMDLLLADPNDGGALFTDEAVQTIRDHWEEASKACGLGIRRRGAA